MFPMHQQPGLSPLIQALLDPARYPGSQVRQVELLQTHISWVLLAGDFAYKIKKPLKLPFLDFSTLALRKQYCDDELRLNRRYAPDIYLNVVPICDTPQGLVLGDGDLGTPVEYAVRMRRFDESGRLDRVCVRGALTAAHVSDLAGTLFAFHATAAVAPPGSPFGSPAQVLAPMMDNFHDLAQMVAPHGGDDLQRRLQALRDWTLDQFTQLTPLVAARKTAGWTRECHGDLHLANMVLIEGRVRLFDCLEFNEDLRWIDVACDHSFAYIDLLEHGQVGLANWFANEVLALSGDDEATPLLRLYAVYRAMVRAKVAAIRAGQSGGDDGGESTKNDMRLLLSHAEQLVATTPLRLVITHGLAGCGKTYASDRLLQRDTRPARCACVRTWNVNACSAWQPAQRSSSATNAGISTPDAHLRTYERLQHWGRPCWAMAGGGGGRGVSQARRTRCLSFDCQGGGAAFAIVRRS